MTDTRLVLIIGCARAGTHWLAETLARHPDVEVHLEDYPQFPLSRALASGQQSDRDWMLEELANTYRNLCLDSKKAVVVDKCHTNFWQADEMKTRLQGSLDVRFVNITREPYDHIWSLLGHAGVYQDLKYRWITMPSPCPLLGLDSKYIYGEMDIYDRAWLKWRVHQDKPPVPAHLVTYESLRDKFEDTWESLQEYLDLSFVPLRCTYNKRLLGPREPRADARVKETIAIHED